MALDYPYALYAQRYRELLDADFARLRSLVDAAADHPVPECPGWTGADAAHHTGVVYQHKVDCIRTRASSEFPPEGTEELSAAEALDRGYANLVAELDAHDADDPAYTWWPEDQTVGFWLRRMAHETAVHRRDVESAAGDPTGVAPDLAVDGIDEVLDLFVGGDWEDEAVASATGRSVRIESGGHAWVVTLGSQVVGLDRSGETESVATVTGEPSDVLLWLWGRAPLPGSSGDDSAVTELRERLALATD